MSADSTKQYDSLSWVKEQLDVVLTDAQQSFSDYIENNEDIDSLQQCVDHLRLVFGTLQMVEVFGASMLAEEMQKTAQAQLDEPSSTEENVFDVLMRSMLQLPDYLEGLQAGNFDSPITLLPLINNLRAARKDEPLEEISLFTPAIDSLIPEVDAITIDGVEISDGVVTGKLDGEAKRLGSHYQRGLLDLIKNNKKKAGLKRIHAVSVALDEASSVICVKNFWQVVSVFVELVVDGSVEIDASVKKILAAVDRSLKALIKSDEESFSTDLPKDILKDALYFIGRSQSASEKVLSIKQAFRLNELLPDAASADALSSGMGGLNTELFISVSDGIKDDLTQVKDVLEIYMHSENQDVASLDPVVGQLRKIGDTYGMLGLDVSKSKTMAQADVLDTVVKGEVEINEDLVMRIAGELLSAESELSDYIAQRSGVVDAKIDESSVIPATEYRDVLVTVVSEGLSNFTFAKEAILSFISGIGNKEQLDDIVHRLEEVRGITLMLSMERLEKQVSQLMSYVQVALIEQNHVPEEEEQEAVADVITCIEYFLESMVEGRLGVEAGLVAGDRAAHFLMDCIEQYEGLESVTVEEVSDVESISTPDELVKAETPQVELAEVTTAAVIEASKSETPREEYIILADDADEEILEIFIEEAIEVLEALNENYPKWESNNDNEEALTIVRRSFHTLKGSGRLIGAQLIGEFSWKFENMLNRLIENQISISDHLFKCINEALAVIPQLIEQLKGNREPVSNIYALMDAADTISEGGVPESAAVAESEVVVETEQALEAQPEVTEEFSVEEVSVEELESSIEIQDEAVSLSTTDEIVDLSDFGTSDDESKTPTTAEEDFAKDLRDSLTAEVVSDASGSDEFEAEDVPEITAVSDGEFVISLTDTENETDIDFGDFAVAGESDVAEPGVSEPEVMAGSDDEFVIGLNEMEADEAAEIESLAEDIDLVEAGDIEEAEVSTGSDDEFIISESQLEVDDGLVELREEADGSDVLGSSIEIDESVSEEETLAESDGGESIASMDPVLFGIYYDESMGRLNYVNEVLSDHDSGKQQLTANKDLIRAFHTLYGSARTAEIEAIAELCGVMEKYVKAREEAEQNFVPDEVVAITRQVVVDTIAMIESVKSGGVPKADKALLTQINDALQEELQNQLQHSIQASDEEAATSGVDGDEEVSVVPSTSAGVDLEKEDVASISDIRKLRPAYEDIDEDLIDIFLEEADELLESCDAEIIALEGNPESKDSITVLQRDMHTLKGGARMAELTPVGDLTHALESLVIELENKKLAADKTMFDLLHESMDSLNDMLASVRNREEITYSVLLVKNIEALMRGEAIEQRKVERFDIDIDDLPDHEKESEEVSADTEDEDEEIVITDEALAYIEDSIISAEPAEEEVPVVPEETAEIAKSGWGERATDVNYRESQDQVRVKADLLNELVNSAGEVNIFHARMGKQITDIGFNLSELEQTVIRLKEQLRSLDIETEMQIRSSHEKESDRYEQDFDPLEMDRYSTMQQLSRSLSETASDVQSIKDEIGEIVRDSETLLMQESRVSSELQEGLMRTRMVRFGGLSSRMRRIVRQTARELDKEVELEITGDTIEVDRKVLDNIIAPLEHMLRNAVAHGIEEPQKRAAAGKDETGTIKIAIDRTGAEIRLKIDDDGAGMSVSAIRAKAIERGMLEEDSDITDQEVLQFILKAGFSTADNVTQIAGRGVGMDVVDSEIKQLGGLLEIETAPGKGTGFTITLPVTLAINQALLVTSGEEMYAVPLASIEGVVRVTGHELQQFYNDDQKYYEFNGVDYELKHLGQLLTGRQGDYGDQYQLFPVLLAKVGEHYFALHVDDLIERREIVVKPIGHQLGMVKGISGATILADGRVVLIIEMAALVVGEILFRSVDEEVVEEQVKEIEADREKVVMIVDDSITIRKVTSRMLERNGINVISAKDGVDATNQLQDAIPDLMLLDIEMPRMDGFELATYMRNDDRLKDIPIIMITSRTGEKHKEKAFAIGVNRYLGKPYQEEELMNNINEIFGT